MPYQPTWVNQYMPQNPYQQVVPNMTQPVMQQYQQPVNGITKVNGRDSALQYQLPPNSMSPALFDNNGQVFYIVSTDGTGMKSVETFDYTPHVEQVQAMVQSDAVRREEFNEALRQIGMLKEELDGLRAAVPPAV